MKSLLLAVDTSFQHLISVEWRARPFFGKKTRVRCVDFGESFSKSLDCSNQRRCIRHLKTKKTMHFIQHGFPDVDIVFYLSIFNIFFSRKYMTFDVKCGSPSVCPLPSGYEDHAELPSVCPSEKEPPRLPRKLWIHIAVSGVMMKGS